MPLWQLYFNPDISNMPKTFALARERDLPICARLRILSSISRLAQVQLKAITASNQFVCKKLGTVDIS